MKKILLIILILSITLFLTGCGGQKIYLCADGSMGGNQQIISKNVIFVCPNGQETTNYEACQFQKQYTILQKDAEYKALNFANGHLQANGWQATLVNAHVVDGDWLAQIVVAKYDEKSFDTVIKIDGTTGFASCESNCEYLN